MANQPYIVVSANDPNTLATNVCTQMALGYIPLGAPFQTTTYGSSITGTNKTISGVETVNVSDLPASITFTFYQAMMLKVAYEYDYAYKIYNQLY